MRAELRRRGCVANNKRRSNVGSKTYSKPLIHGMAAVVALFVSIVYARPAAVSSTVVRKTCCKVKTSRQRISTNLKGHRTVPVKPELGNARGRLTGSGAGKKPLAWWCSRRVLGSSAGKQTPIPAEINPPGVPSVPAARSRARALQHAIGSRAPPQSDPWGTSVGHSRTTEDGGRAAKPAEALRTG